MHIPVGKSLSREMIESVSIVVDDNPAFLYRSGPQAAQRYETTIAGQYNDWTIHVHFSSHLLEYAQRKKRVTFFSETQLHLPLMRINPDLCQTQGGFVARNRSSSFQRVQRAPRAHNVHLDINVVSRNIRRRAYS